jgi:hypothetical protein
MGRPGDRRQAAKGRVRRLVNLWQAARTLYLQSRLEPLLPVCMSVVLAGGNVTRAPRGAPLRGRTSKGTSKTGLSMTRNFEWRQDRNVGVASSPRSLQTLPPRIQKDATETYGTSRTLLLQPLFLQPNIRPPLPVICVVRGAEDTRRAERCAILAARRRSLTGKSRTTDPNHNKIERGSMLIEVRLRKSVTNAS